MKEIAIAGALLLGSLGLAAPSHPDRSISGTLKPESSLSNAARTVRQKTKAARLRKDFTFCVPWRGANYCSMPGLNSGCSLSLMPNALSSPANQIYGCRCISNKELRAEQSLRGPEHCEEDVLGSQIR
ncbi:hypothetical protein ACHAPT_009003 [Fusarium lateritium]